MKQEIYEITENRPLTDAVFRMRLNGDVSALSRPGQFVNIKLAGCFLRRPISVCDWDGNGLILVYKVVGQGTELMSRLAPGEKLDLLTGLGNGYDLSKSGDKPLLIGGGVGVPPLIGLARRLLEQGKSPRVLLGFNRAAEVFGVEEFTARGLSPDIATLDGSAGRKGLVTDLIAGADFDYVFTCGPEPMLKAVYQASSCGGQYSFEERMGCGFGACMGCSCRTKYGYKRICKDGPVLEREEIIW
ncbi:MAG: dihydroorotate dehydrogenase electron transfer subunit [Firmicutes bacterium]|nr:dihydroorotate dehydrogenase electron transfer subunit [Bacillota bacterium]